MMIRRGIVGEFIALARSAVLARDRCLQSSAAVAACGTRLALRAAAGVTQGKGTPDVFIAALWQCPTVAPPEGGTA